MVMFIISVMFALSFALLVYTVIQPLVIMLYIRYEPYWTHKVIIWGRKWQRVTHKKSLLKRRK